ncbi:glycerophosphoryl diester phosphodiesterase [Paraburkholderia silvatlantica]|uniref:Glycerophosphoryl diester phosphodiesterase n=1 Tax=Paraburkholderia silvatlantica TaxID=321895 RepID=A0ABR6FYB5_9BURK|nr:glycerophosphoryl diester phosphodiesterase [Paraburkholderia silvatlantica]PVY20896.1 glycerophosphoryl diester phosphodiesterase [Paraburkholderia silvatlantica]PXW25965.1 glycerophosphoryl diester phosphodiesterase [Paraburkholderia silvatlantica]
MIKSWPYPRVAAHRGGGTLAPENTLAGLRTGANLGHTMVEFDARLSVDNVAFLLHDDTVNRTSNGHGAAAYMRYAELATLDAGSWRDARFAGEPMPTLAQVAACCRELGLAANVEIKPCTGRDVETGRIVGAEAARLWENEAQAGTPPLLSSFSCAALEAARDSAPELPRGLLFERVPADWREQTAALECVSLHASHRHLDEALVERIKAAGLFILAYTVNDLERARQLVSWGVDTVCTDRIDLIGPHALDA